MPSVPAAPLPMSRILLTGVTVVLVAIAVLCGLPVLAIAYEPRSPDYECAVSQALPAGTELEQGATGVLLAALLAAVALPTVASVRATRT